MSTTIANAIEISLPSVPASKFDTERRAFESMLPTLLGTHRGQYVAIHNEQIVDAGDNRLDVALRVLRQIGNTDIYVGLVAERPEPVSRSGVRREVGRDAS